ncbi:MAG: hypothetical protein ACTHY4_01460 [Flavobacteriaceae bacterium]|nr:hypothetical protein [Psychroflexus sp.]
MKNIQILFLLSLLFFNSSFSQVYKQEKDSTESVYDKIEDYSDQTKTSKFLHRLVFRSQNKSKGKTTRRPKQNYTPFEGKIIRQIKVDSHDPFGFSFTDSTKTERNWLERTGNKIHIKSKDFAIKNYLIIKKNKPLDSLKLKESERLIRKQRFIRDVEITVKPVDESSDSVDVVISTLDSWSLVPHGSFSDSKMRLQLKEQNYLGYGHQLKVGVRNRFSDGKLASELLYTIPNYKNTYITSTLGYREDLDGAYRKRFNIGRSFFSPYTRWAAGIYLDEQFRKVMLPGADIELDDPLRFRYRSQDIWAGYSFHLFKGQSERERAANIITSFRFLHIDYRERPSRAFDDINFFSSETFYLGSLGISSRQFVEDSYIFRDDGVTENVPIGDVYAITAGNQYKNKQNRLYLGAKIAHGNYFDWGYLSTSLEFGTFFNKSKAEQTAYSLSVNYFTNLISLGGEWRMRQFIKPQFIIGKNRLNSIGDRLTIDETNDFRGFYGNQEERENSIGIPGFDSNLLGTSKYVLSLQTQFYTPWSFIGFRFNPYLNINTAMLSDKEKPVINGKLYSSFSVGVILRNEYLVFNSIRLSLSYYPSIPGRGDHIINTHAINLGDDGLHGFELGKPEPVWYN